MWGKEIWYVPFCTLYSTSIFNTSQRTLPLFSLEHEPISIVHHFYFPLTGITCKGNSRSRQQTWHVHHQVLIASSFKPFSKVQSVLFHPPPACPVFSRLHDSTQNCFRGIGQSKAGWRKRSKKRLQHTESTGLGHSRGQAEGLDHKGFCWPSALSVAGAHRYELWMCQFGAGADGIETPWLGRREVQVSCHGSGLSYAVWAEVCSGWATKQQSLVKLVRRSRFFQPPEIRVMLNC